MAHRESLDPGPEASWVRPYTLTAGRTDTSIALPVHAPVQAVSPAPVRRGLPGDRRDEIVALCIHGPSVAEVAARLALPLGVARVLVGDLVVSGHLRVRPTLDDRSTRDERRELIERTLRGLRARG